MDQALKERLLNSIEANRLVIFCGAGLSMSPPSNVPSAKALAIDCADKYEAIHGATFSVQIREDLERLAGYFYGNQQLYSMFISQLIPLQKFIRNPNSGHVATADFLVSGVVEAVVSTNVDVLIEDAARNFGETHYGGDIDGNEANTVRARKPHLKIHGCLQRDDRNTVWCKGQLEQNPLRQRHQQFKDWLTANLRERDLIFVGFWSDWSYLNDIFQDALGGIDRGLVVIVNPSDVALLETKAPMLWNWSGGATVTRVVVNQSADIFLTELRLEFWKSFIERLLRDAAATYRGLAGKQLDAIPALPANLTCDELYTLHLDICGSPKGTVARKKRPDNSMQVLGAVQIGLLNEGAQMEGNHYILRNSRLRVVNGQGRLLSHVRSVYEGEAADFIAPQITICVGAKDDGGVPPDIVRSVNLPSVVRASETVEWLTEDNAKHLWAGEEVGNDTRATG